MQFAFESKVIRHDQMGHATLLIQKYIYNVNSIYEWNTYKMFDYNITTNNNGKQCL